ncbi:hypothetical protein F8M41_022834 [Gigaspora margarita]|uniref:Uncharacterized protein n=1 Tax=Gigaspora margarita TaxID=4874 RepID=A0A8H4B124_GIGMA|nr:hypothetical protein F8M41_022834 [Gigaspora margarita]
MSNSSSQSQELVNPIPNSSISYKPIKKKRPISNLNQSLLKTFKSSLINNKKMQQEQTIQSKKTLVQKSKKVQVQESREVQVQKTSEAQVHEAREAQVCKVREVQAQNQTSRNNQQTQVIEHHENEQALIPISSKERRALQPIMNNIIIQIPDTEKSININLKISFNNQ